MDKDLVVAAIMAIMVEMMKANETRQQLMKTE